MTIVRYTTEELAQMKSKTDWEKIDAMTDEEIKTCIAADPDTFEITDEMFAKMRPAAETHPEIVEAYNRARGKQEKPTKTPLSIRLDRTTVEFFKSRGKGWQTEINDILHEYVDSHQAV